MPENAPFWDCLYLPRDVRNRRVSSNEQPNWNDGNMDMTWLQPGETLEMPVLEGPGVVRHMWFTSHSGAVGELDSLTLRIFWDDASVPSVEVPLGLFFAVGQGRPAPVESIPVQVSPSGSLTCYWPMPFHRNARITVTNDHPYRGTGLYWQVDWEQTSAIPEHVLYFHAAYRQEYPAVMGRDYLIADLHGEGKYVGTVLSVTLGQDGWFGEGDDFFYVDGEDVPSLQGTGTEDYFNDAWGFRVRTGPWFGQPRWEGYEAGDAGVCYRWHVMDPVHFRRSLKVTIEHKGNLARAEEGFFLERPDYLSSIAYWYQKGISEPWTTLPGWPERLPPWTVHPLVRSFPAVRVIGNVRPRISCEGMFGARPVLVWPVTSAESALTIPFVVPATDRYALRLVSWESPEGGTFDIELDGSVVVVAACFRSSARAERLISVGSCTLEEGMHTLAFVAKEPPGELCVESLRMLRLPPQVSRPIKGKHEAHFIRLGIGRAVYAYRLAYDTLPDSLEELVEAGIMEERYLSDENGVTLKSRKEAEAFVVEAPGWTHRWQGRDPRS